MTGTVTALVQTCEAEITAIRNGLAFVPAAERNHFRVYTLAKLFGFVETSAGVEDLLISSPAAYEGFLRKYHALLTGRAQNLWWQRVAEARSPRWGGCIKRAIERAARRSQVTPAWLGWFLDITTRSKARDMIISNARAYLAETGEHRGING